MSMARTGGETAAKPRMQYRGLRGWLEQVDNMGELRKVDAAHWDVEMGAITHMLTEKGRDKKLKGTFPITVDVSTDLRRKLRSKFPQLFPKS
jgi:hypothetical protein